jgi:hypothetical protein
MNDPAATKMGEKSDKGIEFRFAPMSWRNSYWIVILIAISIGTLTIVTSLALDWAMNGTVRRLYASDLLEWIVIAFFSGVALVRMQVRRRELVIRMQIVEDVNHHVRNALTFITLSTSLREDAQLDARVRDACERIDWVLSDVLSQTVRASQFREPVPKWHSGRQLNKSA